MNLKFTNDKGEAISGTSFAITLLIVAPLNFFTLSYLTMILAGVLHSNVSRFPALGFWTSACLVALFKVFSWENGPFHFNSEG